jgi:hypothetical protein
VESVRFWNVMRSWWWYSVDHAEERTLRTRLSMGRKKVLSLSLSLFGSCVIHASRQSPLSFLSFFHFFVKIQMAPDAPRQRLPIDGDRVCGHAAVEL